MVMRLAHLLMIFSIMMVTTAIVRGCDDNESITDCSSRNKPMKYDRQKGKWHCDD